MEKEEAPTLDDLMAGACGGCGKKALVVHAINVRAMTVTLRCEACGRLRHNLPYRDA